MIQPGEEIRIVTFGHTRPRGTAGLEMVIGMLMLRAMRFYILVLTDRRFLLLDCGRPHSDTLGNRARPQSVSWDERFDAVRVATYQEGPLYTKLYLERNVGPAQIIRLLLPRTARDESREISGALGANWAE